jgi:hypothetical protein
VRPPTFELFPGKTRQRDRRAKEVMITNYLLSMRVQRSESPHAVKVVCYTQLQSRHE